MEFAGFSTSQRTSLSQERAFSPTPQSGNALVFVDAALGDRFSWSSLAPGAELYILKPETNAIDQITQALQGRSGVESLQIISHGRAGGLTLGADWLTVDNLDQYRVQIQSWGQALAPGGDILLYGCSVAQGVRGQAFLQGLSHLSGADVAGSIDQTGNAIGGNWNLEVAIGEVSQPQSGRFHYDGLLDLDLISGAYAISQTAGGIISPRQSTSRDGRFVVFTSGASNIVANDRNGKSDVFLLDRSNNSVTLVSQGTTGASANNSSSNAVISADGNYVAFVSDATDLTAGDANTDQDAYIWDRNAGTIELITKTVDTAATHGRSERLSISDDGSVVAFESLASDLLAADPVVGNIDANGRKDVFYWKRSATGSAVSLVSLSSNGTSGDRLSFDPVVSGDGKRIAFVSQATDLVDIQNTTNRDSVYLFDENIGLLRVSAKADGSLANGSSAAPIISRDGKRIAFKSSASDLTSQTDGNASEDLFVWTQNATGPLAGTVQLVSVATSGTATGAAATGGGIIGAGAGVSEQASLSDDGSLISFTSLATDLVANDTNNQKDIFLRNLTTGTTTLVSGNAGAVGTGESSFSSISADGQTIAFRSAARNLDPNSTSGVLNTFVYKAGATGPATTTLLTKVGNNDANGPTNSVVISGDGSTVVFDSDAINLVAQDSNGTRDVFSTSVATPAVVLASSVGTGLGSATGSLASVLASQGALSDDGSTVIFTSNASDLAPGDTNGLSDIFVRSIVGGSTQLISAPNDSTITNSSGVSDNPLISGDGRYAVFDSTNSRLVATTTGNVDNNNFKDVFFWNSTTGNLQLISAVGTTVGDRASTVQAISADGRYVVFASEATNLVVGDSNNVSDLFLWDRNDASAAPKLISRTAAGAVGDRASSKAVISADGRYVVFESAATNLVAGDTNNSTDIFLYDVATGAVTAVSRVDAAGNSTGASISSGANPRIAFLSQAQINGQDTNAIADVYVRDITGNTTTLVTVDAAGTNAGAGGTGAESAVISRDGKFVSFVTTANNLTATDANGSGADVFIRGLETGGTTRFVSARNGSTANSSVGSSTAPQISGDGRYVIFSSTANDLASNDDNAAQDVFVRDTVQDTTQLLSRRPGSVLPIPSATGASGSGVISNNGAYAVFATSANDAVAGDLNQAQDIVGRSLRPVVSLKPLVATAQEGVTPVVGTYEVSRNENVGNLDVKLAIFGATNAASANDYVLTASGGALLTATATGYTLRIPDGVQTVTLTLTPTDDLAAEAAEVLQLDLLTDPAYGFVAATSSATVTIAANDTTVTTNADSGEGSLRQAILNANAFAGPDTINFQIATGTGQQVIRLQSALSDITGPTVIDGTTQTGSTPTLPLIAIDGTGIATAGTNGLTLKGDGSEIRGLVIQNFTGSGIAIEGSNNTIGGAGTIPSPNANANQILTNGTGVTVTAGKGNVISTNTIRGNRGLAIDLSPTGSTPNDALDADTGANDLQNFPVLTFSEPAGTSATIRGTINAAASTTYRIEFFSNPTSVASAAGQGAYVGFVDVTTDATGDGAINFTAPGLTTGFISATATDTLAKNTSEFSLAREIRPPFPQATISGPTAPVDEGDARNNVSFTVTLDAPYTEAVTIGYTTVAGTATAGRDFQALTGDVTFAPGQTTQTILIPVLGDTDQEDDETFSVKLQNPQKAFLGTTDTAAVTLKNDDFPTVAIFSDQSTQTEGDTGTVDFTFTVQLLSSSTKPVSVTYETVAGTADATDFEAIAPTVLTFAPGETSKTITIKGKGDLTAESTEFFNVKLSNPVNGKLGQDLVEATILDDDTRPIPVISVLANGGGSILEGNTGSNDQVFTISLSSAAKTPVTVNYKTTDATATAGSDYTAIPTTLLTFAPGETQKLVTVKTLGDLLPEGSETFALTLDTPTGATLGNNQAIATILDDDAPPELSVSVAPTGQAEGNSGNRPYTFTVTLSRAATQPVTVNYATGGGTATAGSDYTAANGTLTFAVGETSKTVVVNAIGDTVVEADETFALTLSSPNGATLATAIASATIANDDTVIVNPPSPVVPAISVTPSVASLVEGNSGTQTYGFTISLSQATTRPVTVNYQTQDGEATVADGDYVAASGSVTFAAGETSKVVNVTVNGDQKVEANETFRLLVSSPDNAIATVATGSATGAIVNDDQTTPQPPNPPTPQPPTPQPPTPQPPVLPAPTPVPVGLDGNLDILWRNSRTQEVALWQLNSSPSVNRVNLLNVGSGWQLAGSGDMDGDGEADLFWSNSITGETAIWNLKNNQLLKASLLVNTGAGAGWQAEAVADFNGDSQADVFWSNRITGQTALWFLGNNGIRNAVFLPTVADRNWQFRGVADFNGDGQTDILWHNEVSGQVGIWLTNGGQLSGVAVDLPVVGDRNWKITGVGDLNGDGQTDILWQNRGTTELAFWRMQGTRFQAAVSVGSTLDGNWRVEAVKDFNGDNSTDLVLRNSVSGENSLWYLRNGQLGAKVVLPSTPTSAQLETVADFSRDGKPDLVWRDRNSGETYIWNTDPSVLTRGLNLPSAGNRNWQVGLTADFDRDGDADILWYNRQSGESGIWLTENGQYVGIANLPTLPAPDWQPLAAADFDRDGDQDLLWYNTRNGQTGFWEMRDTQYVRAVQLPTVGDLNWRFAGVGDFDRDGNLDLLWRNSLTDDTGAWKMNGFQFTGNVIYLPKTDSNWRIERVGDFDGDRDADLLWRNAVTGQIAIWRMNGAAIEQGYFLPSVPDANWKIRGAKDFNGDGFSDLLWQNTATGSNVVWYLNNEGFGAAIYLPTIADPNWSVVGLDDFQTF